MLKNRDNVTHVYDLLDDDVSKETYEKIVRFRLIDDSTEVPTITQESQYFEKDFYRNETDACFVDCGAFKGPGSFMADIGNESVNTITIDKALEGRKATYIKMNIEGSEIKALKGAENTIKNFRPLIAAAGYHKTRDLWEVPMIIKSFNPDYRFNLRSYMNHLSFIYYCS